MGLCTDSSVTFLRNLGYNVVRHPNAALKPLDLVGVQDKESNYLGPLDLLISNPPATAPAVTMDVVAANINGQLSSKLSIDLGANILGSVIGALGGGNLGASVTYTNARTIQFQYTDVLNDQVVPLQVGNYLRDGRVDSGNLILKQYVLGNGDLYLITKTAKSKKFSVAFEMNNGAAAKVDVPLIQSIAGGSVNVTVDAQRKHVVSFEGAQPLVFGFQCFQVGVTEGNLSLTAIQAGGVVAAAGVAGAEIPAMLTGQGLLFLTYN